MGCSCNNQLIANEKSNEMKQNEQEKQFNTFQKDKSNKIEIDNNNENENNEDETNKLRSAPPQAGFRNEQTIKENKNNENKENIFLEVKTDKITNEDFNSLIEKYPKIENDVTVEKRNPQEEKDKNIIYYGELDKNNNIRHGRGIQIWQMEKNI